MTIGSFRYISWLYPEMKWLKKPKKPKQDLPKSNLSQTEPLVFHIPGQKVLTLAGDVIPDSGLLDSPTMVISTLP